MPKAKFKRLYIVPILSKGLDVLELLSEMHGPLSLEDVYRRTEISKTSYTDYFARAQYSYNLLRNSNLLGGTSSSS